MSEPMEAVISARQVVIRPAPGVAATAWEDREVPGGAVVRVVGPSGCGKTTLLRALLGQHPVTSGTLLVKGGAPDPRRAPVYYVPQDAPAFDDEETVVDFVERPFGFRRHRRGPGDLGERAAAAAASLGLAWRPEQRVASLSGGERRRWYLVRGLLLDLDVWLLDEPTAGLDEAAAKKVVTQVCANAQRTVVVVTHDAWWDGAAHHSWSPVAGNEQRERGT